jgi:hypothetical protein
LTIVKQMLDNCQVPGDGKSTPMAWGEYATGHGGHARDAGESTEREPGALARGGEGGQHRGITEHREVPDERLRPYGA